jgi:hypothetical protein
MKGTLTRYFDYTIFQNWFDDGQAFVIVLKISKQGASGAERGRWVQ